MSQLDVFGRKMIYPTSKEPKCAKPWFLGINNWKSRVDDWEGQQSTDTNGNLQFKVKPNGNKVQTRFKIQALPGQNEVTEKDQDKLRERGYMNKESDWKNVEVTFYGKINEIIDGSTRNGGPHFEIEARSGMHGGDHHKCEGTALHTNIYPNGRIKLEKELSHTDGYCDNNPEKRNATDNLIGKWFGMKGIFYNMPNNNVKIELWLDKNANNDWGNEPVLDYLDTGNWKIKNNRDNECDGKKNEKIVWGGPIVILRSDEIKDFDVKCVSVREIVPPN